ncbi:class I SAM-dependent methyltransferase [Lysobacter arvi]|uniref:Methyltransferase n=1 Tax=Lysobacter arvi TaxID=3038776 RepID=A0ABU1CHJ2_9GAMM|nr:methyltransferase [Lysobacter arvi]MDR0184412.1 methyltransferase [Lysobacter arvi]
MKRLLLAALVPALLVAHGAVLAQSATAAPKAAAPAQPDAALQAAVDAPTRDAKNRLRDPYRHPAQTLAFFGVKPTHTVVEITPGGGWYTEILAPYLKNGGHYVAAMYDPKIPNQPQYRYRQSKAMDERLANTEVYGKTEVRNFDPKAPNFGPAGSADVVLTFRNAHNWVDDGTADAYFKGFFDVLKPGGTLGLVDHRAKPGTDLEKMKTSGYLTEALVVELAQKAGFKLQARSEINANPKDTADHPNGVWTLPPSNQHDAADDAKYKAIGESDRMTLRFVKP